MFHVKHIVASTEVSMEHHYAVPTRTDESEPLVLP